jgi:hypothetical protein
MITAPAPSTIQGMTIFSADFMAATAQCLNGTAAIHEHVAWHANMSLEEDRDALKMLGYEVLAEVTDIAIFLARGNDRIELIQPHIPAHQAWLVLNRANLDGLERKFGKHPEFTFLDGEGLKFDLAHLVTRMFQHVSGPVVQLVWRKKQIYKVLFEK